MRKQLLKNQFTELTMQKKSVDIDYASAISSFKIGQDRLNKMIIEMDLMKNPEKRLEEAKKKARITRKSTLRLIKTQKSLRLK
jgi:hypothetical protein